MEGHGVGRFLSPVATREMFVLVPVLVYLPI